MAGVDHHPRLITEQGRSYAWCNCGWKSRRYVHKRAAMNDWSTHVRQVTFVAETRDSQQPT